MMSFAQVHADPDKPLIGQLSAASCPGISPDTAGRKPSSPRTEAYGFSHLTALQESSPYLLHF